MVRSASTNDARSQTATPTQPQGWEEQSSRPPSRGSNARPSLGSVAAARESSAARGSFRESRDAPQPERFTAPSERFAAPSERFAPPSRHARTDSEATGAASSGGYPETTQSGPRRAHDYDVQAMETSLTSPRSMTRNPIPAPMVTVRSEFPTISRSRQQQTLTCLITIEVRDSKWRPDPEDLQPTTPMPLPTPMTRVDEAFPPRPPSPARSVPRFYPYESPELLEEMTQSLRSRVDNWHGLDFSR